MEGGEARPGNGYMIPFNSRPVSTPSILFFRRSSAAFAASATNLFTCYLLASSSCILLQHIFLSASSSLCCPLRSSSSVSACAGSILPDLPRFRLPQALVSLQAAG